MRYLLIALLLTSGCAGMYGGDVQPGPIARPFYQESTLEGSGTVQSVFLYGVAVTMPFQWAGRGKLVLKSDPPYAVTDGTLVISPLPIYVAETRQAVAEGRMLFLRDGKPAAMVAPGSLNVTPEN